MKNQKKIKEEIAQKIERADESEINRRIVLLFLEKLELLTNNERKTIIETIQLLNKPIFVINVDQKQQQWLKENKL